MHPRKPERNMGECRQVLGEKKLRFRPGSLLSIGLESISLLSHGCILLVYCLSQSEVALQILGDWPGSWLLGCGSDRGGMLELSMVDSDEQGRPTIWPLASSHYHW